MAILARAESGGFGRSRRAEGHSIPRRDANGVRAARAVVDETAPVGDDRAFGSGSLAFGTPPFPRRDRVGLRPEAALRFSRFSFEALKNRVTRRVSSVPPGIARPDDLPIEDAAIGQRDDSAGMDMGADRAAY